MSINCLILRDGSFAVHFCDEVFNCFEMVTNVKNDVNVVQKYSWRATSLMFAIWDNKYPLSREFIDYETNVLCCCSHSNLSLRIVYLLEWTFLCYVPLSYLNTVAFELLAAFFLELLTAFATASYCHMLWSFFGCYSGFTLRISFTNYLDAASKH